MEPFFNESLSALAQYRKKYNLIAFKKLLFGSENNILVLDQEEKKKQFEFYASNSTVSSAKDLFELLKIVDKGYQLNEWEKKQLYFKIYANNTTQVHGFEIALNNQININEDYIIYSLINEQYINDANNPKFKELVNKKLTEDKFKRKLFLTWKTMLESVVADTVKYQSINDHAFYSFPHDFYQYKIENFAYQFKHVLFDMATPNEYFHSLHLLKNIPEYSRYGNKMDRLHAKQNSQYKHAQAFASLIEIEDWYNLKEKINKTDPEKIKLITDIENKILNPTLYQEIPLESKEILENIKSSYEQLVISHEKLAIDDKVLADIIYNKRLPELFSRFNNIHEGYRKTLENIKENNADSLLLTSLKDVETIFLKILNNLDIIKINELSSTANYIKQLKNKL